MSQEHTAVRAAMSELPRWHVVHWGDSQSSTLLCLWVGGAETLVPVDGDTVRYAGQRRRIDHGTLVELLREIQAEQDTRALSTPAAQLARQDLLAAWEVSQAPSSREWAFPRGGFIRWLVDRQVHLEAGDSTSTSQPLPPDLREVLVDLGWNPPGGHYRNCWLRPQDLENAADLAVLTPLAAFGYTTPPERC